MELKLTLKVCMMVAILAIFCFTPLGSIPIGPIVATLSAVPVIISSLTFGKKVGMFMGFMFGLFSFIYWTFIMPALPTAFLFSPFSESAGYKGNVGSLIICFVPRILSGLTPIVVSDMFSMTSNNDNSYIGDVAGSFVGSMTNTILVLLFIFVIFGKEYTTIANKDILYILGVTVLTNGIPEAIVCMIVCPAVAKILRNYI